MPGISEKRLREGKKKGRNARIFRGGRFTAGNGRHQEYAFKNEYPPPEANAQDRMEPVKKVLICLFVQQNAVTARSSPFFIIMVRFEMEPSFFIYNINRKLFFQGMSQYYVHIYTSFRRLHYKRTNVLLQLDFFS
ncbi:hypothetical protein AAV30_10815 [Bacillus velezensis]|nr:hypothetical protein AAV30_10815 [Bacillus velezensis]